MVSIRRLKLSKTLNKWILSYLTILLIPIVITGIFFLRKNMKDAKNLYIENAKYKTQNFSKIIDDSFFELKKLCVQWSLSALFSNVIKYIDNDTVDENYKEYMSLLGELKNHILTNNMIDEIFIVLPNSNIVISKYGNEETESFFLRSVLMDDETYECIMNEVSEFTYYSIHQETSVKVYGKEESVIPVVQSLRYSLSTPPATLIIFANPNYIRKMTASVFGQNEGVFRIISEDGSLSLLADGLPQIGTDVSSFSFSVESQISNWKYVFQADKIDTRINLDQIWKYSLIVGMSAFVFGVLIAFFLIYINYSPLYELFKNASFLPLKTKHGRKVSEYEIIGDSLNYLTETKESFESKLNQYEPLARNALLTKVIKGYITKSEDICIIFSQFDFVIRRYSAFTVCLTELGERKAAVDESFDADIVNDKQQVIHFIQELLFEYGYEHSVFECDYNKIATIIQIEDEEKNLFLLDKHKINEKIRPVTEELTGRKVYTAFGDILGNISEISNSYHKAEKTLEDLIFSDDMGRQIAQEDSSFFLFPEEWKSLLKNHLILGDSNSVIEILGKIKQENLIKRTLQANMFRWLILEVIDVGMNVLKELNLKNLFNESEHKKLFMAETGEKMWSGLESMFHDICSLMLENKGRLDDELKNKMISYVDKNILLSDMSLNKVSDEFDIHPSTVSIKFKQYTGRNFLDYINVKRIDQAKKMMRETAYEICQISEKVGYTNYSTFSRLFSKYEGISPVKYRTIKNMVYAAKSLAENQ